jgi:hypothetical protein
MEDSSVVWIGWEWNRTLLINKHDSGLAIFFTDISRGSFV